MFVNRLRPMTPGALSIVALLGTGLLSGCEDPVANTDLRPEGAPEVLSILVMNDIGDFDFAGRGSILETATFCKKNDAKRPGLVAVGETFTPVQVCDDDLNNPAGSRVPDMTDPNKLVFEASTVKNAVPGIWWVRIMFDELLNPEVESLKEILQDNDGDGIPETPTGQFEGTLATTQPVIVKCTDPAGAAQVVDYDGYYSPSGNAFTWPLGPSLFIQPTGFVRTGAKCTIEIKETVVDKQGLAVEASQRANAADYVWEISPLEEAGKAPAAAAPGMEEELAVDAPMSVAFNAPVSAASFAVANVEIKHSLLSTNPTCDGVGSGGTVVAAANIDLNDDGGSLNIIQKTGWVAASMYSVTFNAANTITDIAGGPGQVTPETVCFVTP